MRVHDVAFDVYIYCTIMIRTQSMSSAVNATLLRYSYIHVLRVRATLFFAPPNHRLTTVLGLN